MVTSLERKGTCIMYKALPALHIDLIRETISHYVIHFRMTKLHKCPLAAMYTALSGEA